MASLIVLCGVAFLGWPPLLAIALLFVNGVVNYRLNLKIYLNLQAMRGCHDLLAVADQLGRL